MVESRNQAPVIPWSFPAVLFFLIMTMGFLSAAHGEIPEGELEVSLEEAWVLGPLPIFSFAEDIGDSDGPLRGSSIHVWHQWYLGKQGCPPHDDAGMV